MNRFFIAALFLMISAAPLSAQEEAKPNPLQPKIVKLFGLQNGQENFQAGRIEKSWLEALVKIYTRNLSEEDVDALIQFYSSPLYKKLRKANAAVITSKI